MVPWELATDSEREELHPSFQRSARHRGKFPDAVYVVRNRSCRVCSSAMQYIEPGKWERWGIQMFPGADIECSWSTMLKRIRPLIGDRAAIEVYPRDSNIRNSAPIRWFWVVPGDELPPEFDLCSLPFTAFTPDHDS